MMMMMMMTMMMMTSLPLSVDMPADRASSHFAIALGTEMHCQKNWSSEK
jgi:hypothetical protein